MSTLIRNTDNQVYLILCLTPLLCFTTLYVCALVTSCKASALAQQLRIRHVMNAFSRTPQFFTTPTSPFPLPLGVCKHNLVCTDTHGHPLHCLPRVCAITILCAQTPMASPSTTSHRYVQTQSCVHKCLRLFFFPFPHHVCKFDSAIHSLLSTITHMWIEQLPP